MNKLIVAALAAIAFTTSPAAAATSCRPAYFEAIKRELWNADAVLDDWVFNGEAMRAKVAEAGSLKLIEAAPIRSCDLTGVDFTFDGRDIGDRETKIMAVVAAGIFAEVRSAGSKPDPAVVADAERQANACLKARGKLVEGRLRGASQVGDHVAVIGCYSEPKAGGWTTFVRFGPRVK